MSLETPEHPPAGRIVLTYEDYCARPDDGRRDRVEKAQLSLPSLWG